MSTTEHTSTTTTTTTPPMTTATPVTNTTSTTAAPSAFHNPKLDALETTHRMQEKAEETANTAKRAVLGGSEVGDKTSEMIHKASNRASEVRQRMADGWNKTMGPVSEELNGANSQTAYAENSSRIA